MVYLDLKELLFDAKNLATGANDLQLKNTLLKIQSDIYDLLAENQKLREENHELKNKKYIKDNLTYCDGVYVDDYKRVYCAVCLDRDERLTRVWEKGRGPKGQKTFSCDICKTWRASNIF